MKCVKTGIKFQVPQLREDTFHGDLFWCNELGFYLIRGIPEGTSYCDPDIILSPWADAYCLDKVAPKFGEDFKRMNHKDISNLVDTVCVVIDDTRFFN